MSKKYWIETYGCQMNVAETHSLEEHLKENEWTASDRADDADIVLLNTCSVRKTAENRIWGRLGFYKRMKSERKFILGVMGCMTERLKDEIRKDVPAVDILIGTFGKKEFASALVSGKVVSGDDFFGESEYQFARTHSGDGDFQAMVPIMHGCNNFCSYCIVPHVRGREISRNPEDIISEINKLEDSGIHEVTLLGQNVNSYDFGSPSIMDFPALLEKIISETNIPWIRFISSHPKDLSDELIGVIAANPRICRHIHLPVQHGSGNILKQMNRRYSREDYITLVGKMRKSIPGLSLTTDIMVGFPGETEEDFQLTMELVKSIKFEDAFTYQYNAIENTTAFSFPEQVDEKIKKRRLGELIELQRMLGYKIKEKYLGCEVTVLVEGISRKSREEVLARTEHNHMVVFPGKEDLKGRLIRVRLNSLSGNTFQGELLCPGD